MRKGRSRLSPPSPLHSHILLQCVHVPDLFSLSFLSSSSPSASPLFFVTPRFYLYLATSPTSPSCKGTKEEERERGASENGARKGRGEEGLGVESSYHGGEDVLVKC